MVKSPCCEKISVEDAKIHSLVSKNNGSGNLTFVSKKAGLKRCGKSCRLRWNNYLRPDLKHDNFTSQEEDLIIKLHAAIGSRWSIIAQQLPGRTDNDVKNHWNTKLKKKLSQMGIDPVTHKPFSKLIADYGKIGGSEKHSTQIGSDLKNAIHLKSEPYQLSQEFRNIDSQPNQSPTSPPKFEPIEKNFLFNITHCDNHPTDFSMPKVSGASNCINLENESIQASSSSTSSSYSTAAQEALPVTPFSWNDFLLEDAFEPSFDGQEHETMDELSFSKELVCQIENGTRQSLNIKEVRSKQATKNDFQVSSSTDISFVEAMLGQENETFLSFPHLMEEPFNY
ncbi:unnamed protein product [Lupinus luteus]|uniref:Transcription factor llmyb35 n=1 Tax=Lupinus luteus TaxID=3873 RepID=A0AA50CB35_LUPLU|nr:transcription factor llmyb35 [Lupinus luteus]